MLVYILGFLFNSPRFVPLGTPRFLTVWLASFESDEDASCASWLPLELSTVVVLSSALSATFSVPFTMLFKHC